MRADIEFPTEDRVPLRGWLYRPEGAGPHPAIVMAHGFSATKEMYLDDFAEVFCKAGFVVMVYDHRNLGESGGEPRGEIDPWQQINDYRAALTWLSAREEVDAERLGIWGSSYSGAHVLVVAAVDRRVKCVVSQVPLVSGLENARRLIRADAFAATRAAFDADRAARYRGEAPLRMKVAYETPGEPCALPTDDTHAFFMGPIRERAPTWKNDITLRSVEMFIDYEPGAYIERISPTPLLMCAAKEDHLTVVDLTLEAYERAREPKKLVILPGGHFDAYVDDNFVQSSSAQRDWFVAHLGKA